MWILEDLLGRGLFTSRALSVSLRSRLMEGGCVKLGHLMRTSIVHLSELLSIRSRRLLLRLVEEVRVSLPEALRAFSEDRTVLEQWEDGAEYSFPSLTISCRGSVAG